MPAPIDYTQAPLGSLPGEQGLMNPYNATPQNVVVSVRNLSASRKRRIVKEYVSFRRGGEMQLNDPKLKRELHGNTSVDELRRRAGMGENLNLEETVTSPLDFIIRFDSQRYLIPYMDPKTGELAPWITVPPGTWDLYCGNYERMHGSDRRERINEIGSLNSRNLARFVINTEDETDERPYAFLEFRREEIKVADVVIDSHRVQSGTLIEV